MTGSQTNFYLHHGIGRELFSNKPLTPLPKTASGVDALPAFSASQTPSSSKTSGCQRKFNIYKKATELFQATAESPTFNLMRPGGWSRPPAGVPGSFRFRFRTDIHLFISSSQTPIVRHTNLDLNSCNKALFLQTFRSRCCLFYNHEFSNSEQSPCIARCVQWNALVCQPLMITMESLFKLLK